ncbi:MAG: thioesterase family protein [Alphaproteobacteria bacterium]|nr:thioesterase family protein [Alphaproteobacteria bacterium]
MSDSAPLVAPEAEVEAGWIDYNGHLNMAYYNVLFDRCADHAFESFGLTETYVRDRGLSFFVAEIHVCYVRELHLGSAVRASFQLLEYDEKRLHAYQELRHRDGWLAATSETLYLHIDASGPKVAPIPASMLEKIRDMHKDHQSLPTPERVGRQITIKR